MTQASKLIAEAITIGGGEIVGRVRLQKMFYLLEQLGLGAELSFEYHHYGPYSRILDEALEHAKVLHGVREEVQHRQSDGGQYSVFRKGGRMATPPSLGQLPAEEAKRYLEKMKTVSSTVLELAATIHWLSKVERVEDWRSELKRRKGSKAENGRAEKALAFLQETGLSPAI